MSTRPDHQHGRSRHRDHADVAPDFRTTSLAIVSGVVASVLIVTAPLATGRLLDVVAATAAGTPQRSLAGRPPARAWLDGLMAWCGALAYLLPGLAVFGGVAVWAASARSLGADGREAASWGVSAAIAVYLIAASVLASAAVTEFAVRRRPRGMLDVTGLVDRLVARRGFWAAWSRTMALIGASLLVTALAWLMIPLPPLAAAAIGSAALFLASVPAAFVWGTFAQDAYGLLAAVPEADSPAPQRTAAASSPRP